MGRTAEMLHKIDMYFTDFRQSSNLDSELWLHVSGSVHFNFLITVLGSFNLCLAIYCRQKKRSYDFLR